MNKLATLLITATLILTANVVFAQDDAKVYLIADVTVNDPETYAKYSDTVPGIVRKYGGRYIVRGGEVTPFAGGWEPERLIVIEFDSMDRMKECFGSDEYLEILPFREQSTDSKAVVVEGFKRSIRLM